MFKTFFVETALYNVRTELHSFKLKAILASMLTSLFDIDVSELLTDTSISNFFVKRYSVIKRTIRDDANNTTTKLVANAFNVDGGFYITSSTEFIETLKKLIGRMVKTKSNVVILRRIYPVNVRGNYGYITLLVNPLIHSSNNDFNIKRRYARVCFRTNSGWLCGYQPYQHQYYKNNNYQKCIKVKNYYGVYEICNRFFPTPKPAIDFFPIIHKFLENPRKKP